MTNTNKRPPRGYWVQILLYPDCERHCNFITSILPKITDTWFGILHDKDVWEDDGDDHKAGDQKKAHWHVVARMPCAKTETAFGSFFLPLGVETWFVRLCDPWSAATYLDHRFRPDRHQYDPAEVFGNIAAYRKECAYGFDGQFDDFIVALDYIRDNRLDYVDAVLYIHQRGLQNFLKSHFIYNYMLMIATRTQLKHIEIKEDI